MTTADEPSGFHLSQGPFMSLPWDVLTNRQLQIFWAHAHPFTVGMSYEVMAEHFGITHDTLQRHLSEIRRRLRVNNRGEITYFACHYIALYQGNRRDETQNC